MRISKITIALLFLGICFVFYGYYVHINKNVLGDNTSSSPSPIPSPICTTDTNTYDADNKQYRLEKTDCDYGGIISDEMVTINFFDENNTSIYSSKNFSADIETIEDVNNDGFKEINLFEFSGGNCWGCGTTKLIQIKGSKVVDLLKDIHDKGHSFSDFKDVDNDGVKELLALDIRWEFYGGITHAASPAISRIYTWDGSKYTDVSVNYPNYYADIIAKHKNEIAKAKLQVYETWGGSELYGNAISMLLAYEAIGKTEQGWIEFNKAIDVDKSILSASNNTLKFKAIEESLSSQYKQGKKFYPEDI